MLQKQALELTHRLLEANLPRGRRLQVLEAGGGSFTHIRLPRERRVAVLDISAEQLARNEYADDKILGDLEEFDGEAGRFDLVVCYDVLEHLGRPERALANMARTLSPGGLMVIGCPNRDSFKGLVTRFTPHFFHVWYYRQVRGDTKAGLPGHAPFPAPMKSTMGLSGILGAAQKLDLEVLATHHYIGETVQELRSRYPLLHAIYAPLASLVGWFCRPERNRGTTDLLIVLRRKRAAKTQPRYAMPARRSVALV